VLEDKYTIIQEQEFTTLYDVSIVMNGRLVYAMVDNGATHNFMKEDVVRELWLQLELTQTCFKVVTSKV
jgi:predicted aspartyl protease